MNKQISTGSSNVSPFDSIRKFNERGQEYWEARSLQELMGYPTWGKFEDALERGKIACKNSGQEVSDHFVQVGKMVSIGSGSQRKVKDYHLSRYASYMVAMNGDPRKVAVSLAQTYFATQTRKTEITQLSHDHINEVHRRIRDYNMLRVEKLRFTVEEKANMLALSGMLKEIGFAANAFLDNSLAKAFYPWCEEQGYDMTLVRDTKRSRLVSYEKNKDGTYNWEKPIKRPVNSYPEDPFGLAWSIFLVEHYWPKCFLPYIKRKYNGEERAKNISEGIKVISFFTGLNQQQIEAKSKKGNR